MNEFEKNKLRKECLKLFFCKTINDSFELIDIYTEFLYQIIMKHHKEPVYNYADADAKMVVQMMLTKTLHLKKIAEGISYNSKDGTHLNRIVDPTIVASLIRNIFETVGMFNLIYRHTKSNDEKIILYCLWVYSGLKYRQRFEQFASTEENIEKMEDEKKQLSNLINSIKETDLYKSLDEKSRKIVNKKIKDKSYLLRFDNKKAIPLHWQELTKTIGFKTNMYDSIYTYFSLYSHPSNVAVFQFSDMFNKGDQTFLKLTNSNLLHYFGLTSVFIADYLKLFPSAQSTFDSLNIRDQIVINFHNTFLRGDEYSINDFSKIVN
jgi:hypothetical protein